VQRFIFIFAVFYISASIFGFSARAQTSPLPFSPTQAEHHFQTGKTAYLREDLTTAINQFQSTLQQWPVHKEAWTWLTAAYQYLRQTDKYRHPLFFRERTAWAMTLDLRHAQQIFKDIAAGRIKKTRRGPRYQAAAKSLNIFYNYIICRVESAQDRTLAQRLSANQHSGLEKIMRLARDPNWYPCRVGKN
ncbi:hypothetical protein N9748_00660, partial [bacterium]|nr:hypothetical protein [bacterium]